MVPGEWSSSSEGISVKVRSHVRVVKQDGWCFELWWLFKLHYVLLCAVQLVFKVWWRWYQLNVFICMLVFISYCCYGTGIQEPSWSKQCPFHLESAMIDLFHSVLWRCWFGVRNEICPVIKTLCNYSQRFSSETNGGRKLGEPTDPGSPGKLPLNGDWWLGCCCFRRLSQASSRWCLDRIRSTCLVCQCADKHKHTRTQTDVHWTAMTDLVVLMVVVVLVTVTSTNSDWGSFPVCY